MTKISSRLMSLHMVGFPLKLILILRYVTSVYVNVGGYMIREDKKGQYVVFICECAAHFCSKGEDTNQAATFECFLFVTFMIQHFASHHYHVVKIIKRLPV